LLPRLTLAALAAVLALPAAAPAATSLGQTAAGGTSCAANAALAQVSSSAPEYTVRAGGVVTELRTEDSSAAGRTLHVFRPRGNSAFTVLASVDVAPGAGVVAIPVRVPVQPGDVLGLSTGAAADPHPNCMIPGSASGSSDLVAYRDSSPAPDSGDVTLPAVTAGRLNVGATLEPDADGDGFGDETQDRCPDDRGRTTQDCAADVVVGQLAVEAEMERDDVNVITISVRNNGSSTARNVRVVEPVPAGLQLVGTTPSTGGCAGGAPVDCTFPAIPAGGAESILVVVRAVATGAKTLRATATSPTPDPNGENNTAELQFDVVARRSVVAPGTFCRVPRLFGLSRTAARRALEAEGCRLGLTRRRRFRSGRYSRVRLQSIPAGTRVAIRTRVHITLRRR
jgi:uncharacterized repeat protein (TIGR01451 family)